MNCKTSKAVLIGNTSCGYCFSPMLFESKNKAVTYARKMISEGYWFAYRLFNYGNIQ